MYFALTKEQKLFQTSVRKYLTSQEKTTAARLFMSGDTVRYEKIWSGLSELGAMAINIPEAYGGAGLAQVDLIPVMEEIGRVLLPGVYAETVAFATPVLTKYGTEQQKKMYLAQIANGQKKFSLAIAERGVMTFVEEGIRLEAIKEGNQYVLNGSKTFVIDGDTVDVLLVAAKVDGQTTLFLVDREVATWEARRLQVIDETKGVTEVYFNQLKVSESAVIGQIGQGWDIVDDGLQILNTVIATIGIGGMEEVVEMCAEYARTREQFGHPIGVFQAVKHRIVDMKVELELAKSLVYYANWAISEQTADAKIAVASARAFTTDAYIEVAAHNIQMHGGIGFTTEIDCHLFLKRARMMESYLWSVQDCYEVIMSEQGWRINEETARQSKALQSNVAT
ncbi:acyl-CoA dehydrogenase family protein [Lysinibacillus sp. KU-BSD001]|uniref:acyl-CoA dehydrogenase family protein n=1 Tax=Lysinibacillus sp. KU-BSD001 TaxID=3141328 RepID=UPI0036EF7303